MPPLPTTGALEILLDEWAAALRHTGGWSNAKGDACLPILENVRALETAARRPAPVLPQVKRPFEVWRDFDAVLCAMIGHPRGYEAGWGFSLNPASPLWLSRQSGAWKKDGAEVPKDLRIFAWGTIVVEWRKSSLLLPAEGGCFLTGITPPLTYL